VVVYGDTKAEAERAVLSRAPGAAVARVALVCGRGFGSRPTASEAVAWALSQHRRLRLFTDQYRTPVDPESVASAIEHLLGGDDAGVFHLGGPERVSRHQLGIRVARRLGLEAARIEPVRQTEVCFGQARPADVSLDSSRAVRELGYAPRRLDLAIGEGRASPVS
jgi:dTDP-4-dehydrorhamnose reductase